MIRNLILTVCAVAALVAGGLILSLSPARAYCVDGVCSDRGLFSQPYLRSQTCYTLWGMRNLIYKENGYCFQTARAREAFGNAGCDTSSQSTARSRMNQFERGNVDAVIAAERYLGCN